MDRDLLFTEAELRLKEEVREFCDRAIEPHVDDIENDEDFELIRKLTRELGEAGYLALDIDGYRGEKPGLRWRAGATPSGPLRGSRKS